jgi:FtsH-binding integral membrane protein
MSDLHQGYPQTSADVAADTVDLGLRTYMLGIYNKVGLGLLLAAAVAYATAHVPALRDMMFTTAAPAGGASHTALTLVGSVVAFSPLFLLLCCSSILTKPTPPRTAALYWSVVALVGASMGVLFLTFTGGSIAMTLAVSAIGFGGLSLIGYRTCKNLTALGSFLIMGLVGLVLTLVANLVLRSPALDYAAGIVGVLVFAGLIAFDTQRLKLAYHQLGGDAASLAVATDLGALSLFINFVNLFQFLLMLASGQRR